MITLKNLQRTYKSDKGSVRAVDNIDLVVPTGSFFTLLGPSGCGKTTTLRSVAGLEKPDGGEIYIDDQLVFSSDQNIFVPAAKREIAMVFQSYAIWPHMSVYENVAFPLRVAKSRPQEKVIRQKVEKALATVRLEGLEDRPAPNLSGGQQQRLALARAIVNEPKLLLLDEPLSNLDAKLREQMRMELRELQQRLNVTTLYVTHDQTEALGMSDWVAVMSQGKVLQLAPPRDIYNSPSSAFVANFIGSINFIPGRVSQRIGADGFGTVDTRHGQIRCQIPASVSAEEVLVGLRPEDIQLHIARPSRDGSFFDCEVESTMFQGEFLDCRVQLGDQTLHARLHPSVMVSGGQRVTMELVPQWCTIIPAQ